MAGATGKYGVVIIGSGFGGIGMGIALRKAGSDDRRVLLSSDYYPALQLPQVSLVTPGVRGGPLIRFHGRRHSC